MNVPKQVPSVQRTLHRFSAVPITGGVRPAGWLDVLKRAAGGALGAVMNG